jgi:RNA polymerase sigma-B factor
MCHPVCSHGRSAVVSGPSLTSLGPPIGRTPPCPSPPTRWTGAGWRAGRIVRRSNGSCGLQALVEQYRGHAEAQARRHYRRGEPIDDLTQVAYEALLLALRRFDPDRRTPFLAFAKPTIIGSLRRHFRDTGWAIRVPRRVHELSTPVRDAQELLTHDLGRPPSPGEVADFIGVEEREVLEALTAEDARITTSLDAPDPASGLQAEQVIGQPDRGFLGIENRTALRQSLELMSEDDRDLLRRYFLEEYTQSQIAEVLGCSQMQVSRLLRKAIHRLRRHMLGG